MPIDMFLQSLPLPSDEPKTERLFSKLVSFCSPLGKAHDFKYIDRHLNEILPSYSALKLMVTFHIFEDLALHANEEMARQFENPTKMMQTVNSEMFDELNKTDSKIFDKSDREILLDVASSNMEIARLFSQIPQENIIYRDLALIDAFSSVQKMDLLFTTIFLIIKHRLQVDDKTIIHKLCLAIKRYLKEVHSAIFLNNPVLVSRLQEPSKNISNADMERLLEISG